MPIRMRHIAREVGTAAAVLALYLLVLLAPLHQSAGLQRDLAQLGFESSHSWSVCTSVAPTGDTDAPTAIKCPLTSVAKLDFGVLPAGGSILVAPVVSTTVSYATAASAILAGRLDHPGQPRGPPQAA